MNYLTKRVPTPALHLACASVVAFLAIVLTTPLASAAQYACAWYDIGNIKFAATQSNGFGLTFQFQQNGSKLEGHAVYRLGSGENSSGPLFGSISRNTFSFTVHWGGGADGRYSGRITDNGGLEGTVEDDNNPASRASWATINNPYPIKCVPSAPQQPTAAPPPGGQTDGIDLPGSDIRRFMTRNEGICKQACAADQECRAWTFVRNGSMCWLKNAVPTAVSSGCCISGVVTADAAPSPARPIKKMGKRKLRPVSVEKSVDVCAAPGGCNKNTRIAVLEAGTQDVSLQEACADNWCHVKWPAGEGWVYDGDDYDSLNY